MNAKSQNETVYSSIHTKYQDLSDYPSRAPLTVQMYPNGDAVVAILVYMRLREMVEIANDSRSVGPKNVSESCATVPSPSLALIAYQAHSVQRLQEKSSYCGRRKYWVWHTVLHGTGSLNPQIHSKPSVPEPAFIHAAPRHNLYR